MSDLAVLELDNFLFGSAPYPVTCGNGLSIGTGSVIPEINFTLSTQEIGENSWSKIKDDYRETITAILRRSKELHSQDLLVEFEALPPMTNKPEWALEITRILSDTLRDFGEKEGVRAALRLTPNDTREFFRPPRMREGEYWEKMLEVFESAAEAGADLLAIESTGGKEVFDGALLEADLEKLIFSLGVLAARDMDFLWKKIVSICNRSGIVASGDTACGFANTAMVLADKGMIPRTLAAVLRVATVPRSLIAYRVGATGPSKDCAYEGPYMKALCGVPISMEGRTASCAHLSPVGNISQAVCDCWSNESVQNVQLLSGPAPVMCLEQLIYDCRLMNVVRVRGNEESLRLRDWLVESDSHYDPQAFVLRPDVVMRICHEIARVEGPYLQTIVAAKAAVTELEQGALKGALLLSERESSWLERIGRELAKVPEDEGLLIDKVMSNGVNEGFLPGEYGL